ncbi:MAG: hypothetical protein PHR92_17490 [Lachnospiraceae bacterium]|nr:hypothetical protein [Lachnospiraceae bacterium]
MIKFYDSMGAAQGISVLSDLVDACDFWQSDTTVVVGQIARSSSDSLIYAECISAGTTGLIEPVWGKQENIEMNDGSAKWLVHDLRNSRTSSCADKLSTPRKINGIEFDGSKDIVLPTDSVDDESFIAKGLKIAAFAGCEVLVGSGIAKVNGNTVNFNGGNITLSERETALLYMDGDGKLGKTKAVYPVDCIDDNTVGFWIFNKTIAGENIPNIAVGKSAIAQKNDFVPNGGITSVDGWADYALQTDGFTGYFELENNFGFMTGDVPFEYNLLITPDKIDGSVDYIFNYAGNVATIYINSNGLLYCGGQNTGYVCETGKTFFLTYQYDSRMVKVFINGRLAFSLVLAISLTLNTGQNTRIGTAYDKSDMLPATFHFLEIRNKIRTQEEIAKIANMLILPCFYEKHSSKYPELPAENTNYTEWKFDDETADNLKETNGINSGVLGGAVVPIQEDSQLGLGKALRFPGAATCYMDVGTMTLPVEFTIVAIANPFQLIGLNRFFGNKIGTPQTFMMCTSADTTAGVAFYTGNQNGNAWINSDIKPDAGRENFIALRATNKNFYFRVNRQSSIRANNIWRKQVTENSAIGACYGTDYAYQGTLSYLLVVPRALSDSEIQVLYDNLMVKGRKNILDDAVPSNAVAVGMVRSDKDTVFEYNDNDYKFGRRDGCCGGNRRVFLGFKYFSGSGPLSWDNPFGTSRVKRYFTWAEDAYGTNEIEAMKMVYVYNSGWGGYWPVSDSVTGNDGEKIGCYISTSYGGVTLYNSAWKTSGYIGCYLEVLEDYKGVDGR